MFGRIFEMKMTEVIEEWLTLLNETLYDLHSPLNICHGKGKVEWDGLNM